MHIATFIFLANSRLEDWRIFEPPFLFVRCCVRTGYVKCWLLLDFVVLVKMFSIFKLKQLNILTNVKGLAKLSWTAELEGLQFQQLSATVQHHTHLRVLLALRSWHRLGLSFSLSSSKCRWIPNETNLWLCYGNAHIPFVTWNTYNWILE